MDSIYNMHPPHDTAFPIFLCLPDFVRGIPVLREIFCLAFVMPNALFQLKPPFPISAPP